jgi:hypothetical protein
VGTSSSPQQITKRFVAVSPHGDLLYRSVTGPRFISPLDHQLLDTRNAVYFAQPRLDISRLPYFFLSCYIRHSTRARAPKKKKTPSSMVKSRLPSQVWLSSHCIYTPPKKSHPKHKPITRRSRECIFPSHRPRVHSTAKPVVRRTCIRCFPPNNPKLGPLLLRWGVTRGRPSLLTACPLVIQL